MKRIFFSLAMVVMLALTACASPTSVSPTQPSTLDQVATVVAATMQAPSTSTAEPPPELPTVDACQVPTFKASDTSSDCFNASGESVPCNRLDLVTVEAGVIAPFEATKPIPTGFIIGFAELPETEQEFTLYLYIDLDQNPDSGHGISIGATTLPGIDRVFGITLPSGDAWTQVVAKGADAEIIRDPAQVSATVSAGTVTVMVWRKLLEDKSVAAGEQNFMALGPAVPVGYAFGGALPDAFTMYLATARGENDFDFFNSGTEFQVPLAMTVPEEALYPVCVGGS